MRVFEIFNCKQNYQVIYYQVKREWSMSFLIHEILDEVNNPRTTEFRFPFFYYFKIEAVNNRNISS